MRILASYNLKGGVGKTAAVVNLAWLAARDGARCLLWDLDPQGASSYYLRAGERTGRAAATLVGKKRRLARAVEATAFARLELLPADLSYRNMDLVLDGASHRRTRLRRLLAGVGRDYEYVFLDCPPNMSLVSENVFRAADALLIPLIPTELSQRAYAQLDAVLDGAHAARLPFFSMVDRRKRLHREIAETFAARHPEILPTHIPYASAVEQMGVRRAPVGVYAPRAPAARAFESLWVDVRARVHLRG